MSLICIKGSEGAGKTRLLSELLETLSFDKTASVIELRSRSHQVFYHNVKVSVDLLKLDHPDFLSNFLLMLESVLADERHFYILIDDADCIEYEIIREIISILSEQSKFYRHVTLVLSMGATPADIEINNLLQKAKIITLTGMTVAQTKNFIDQIYKETPEKMVSISEANQLASLSYGYPGRILKLLQQKNEKAKQPNKNNISKLLVILIIVISIAIFAVMTLNDWFFERKEPERILIEPKVNQLPVVITKEIVPVKIIPVVSVAASKLEASNDLIDESIIDKEKQIELQKVESITVEITEDLPVSDDVTPEIDDKKTAFNYVIELSRHRSKAELERILKGRSIPGKPQFKQLNNENSKIWVAYIGPYGSEKQATQGMKKLPASLQSLPLKVNKEF